MRARKKWVRSNIELYIWYVLLNTQLAKEMNKCKIRKMCSKRLKIKKKNRWEEIEKNIEKGLVNESYIYKEVYSEKLRKLKKDATENWE